MQLSKRIANILFGRYDNLDGKLAVIKYFNHPDGTKIEWPGNNGLIHTLYKRITDLESKVLALELKSKKK